MRNRKRAKFCKNILEKMISWKVIKMASLILYDACRIYSLILKFNFLVLILTSKNGLKTLIESTLS